MMKLGCQRLFPDLGERVFISSMSREIPELVLVDRDESVPYYWFHQIPTLHARWLLRLLPHAYRLTRCGYFLMHIHRRSRLLACRSGRWWRWRWIWRRHALWRWLWSWITSASVVELAHGIRVVGAVFRLADGVELRSDNHSHWWATFAIGSRQVSAVSGVRGL